MSFSKPLSSYSDEELREMRNDAMREMLIGDKDVGMADFRAIVDEQARRALGTSEAQFPSVLRDPENDGLPFTD